MVAQTNVTAVHGVIQTLDVVNGDINAAHDLNAGNDLGVANNATITNQTESGWFQIDRQIGGTALPNTSVPLGQVNRGNVVIASGSFTAATTPTVSLVGSVNINTVTHPAAGHYIITFHPSVTKYAAIQLTYSSPAGGLVSISYNVIATAPLQIDVFMQILAGLTDAPGFSVSVIGE